MHEEIEAKLKVDSLEEVEGGLARVRSFIRAGDGADGCVLRHARRRVDAVGQVPASADREDGRARAAVLAYKGPKQQDDYKKRTEIEIGVNDAERPSRCLAALGYRKALAFNKRRRLWRLHDCEVALDELPLLGVFVEIEGPDSRTMLRAGDVGIVPGAAHHG